MGQGQARSPRPRRGLRGVNSKVGRILADLAARGLIQSVPSLRRRPDARRWTAKRRFARPLPRGLCAAEPGGLVTWKLPIVA